jgi:transmembrane sensor
MQVQKQIDELLALRASEWLEVLPNASKEQLQAFEAWLSESRLHVQEFLEIAEVEFCLGRLDPQRSQDVESLLQRMAPNVTSLPAGVSLAKPSLTRPRREWRAAGFAAAACLLMALATLLVGDWGYSKQYSTSVGEQRVVELPDTSLITLNVSSKVEVRLEDTQREINLRSGEATFKVAHDARRPFRVHTRAGTVQAVGTQFNVYDRYNGDTRVSVLEGKVRAISSSGAEIVLGAGQEADMRLDGSIWRREDAIVANTVAWRQHRLIFEGATIEEMATEFNRYNRSIQLRPEGLADSVHRFDGAFEANDPRSLAAMLTKETDLVVENRGAEIVIRPR